MDENGLYDFYQTIVDRVKETGHLFNWHCELDIPVVDLERVSIIDVRDEAAEWRQKDPARDMYFSHGQYYKDGIQHIIEELKLKPTSNRALYSLLAQNDISESGDDPIPSFLTFQCSIEGSILYCTASFRALEVSRFLKVNLEEIRQNLAEICKALPVVETVRVHIFAFHAYARTVAATALRRPEIDVTSEAQLLRLMQKGEVRTLDTLLGGFERSTTAVSSRSLQSLLGILQMPDADLHESVQSKRELLEQQLKRAIEACGELAASRKGASRGVNTTAKIDAFHAAVKQLRAPRKTSFPENPAYKNQRLTEPILQKSGVFRGAPSSIAAELGAFDGTREVDTTTDRLRSGARGRKAVLRADFLG